MELENIHPTEIVFKERLFKSRHSNIFLVTVRDLTCVMKVHHGRGSPKYYEPLDRELDIHILESTAYMRLKERGLCEKGIVPYFLGSIRKFDPSLCQPHLKPFLEDEYLPSAIFLRYIPNLQMLDLRNYTPQRMKNLVSCIAEIHKALVWHGDPMPRNMMIIKDDPDRVIWMDFDRAETYDEDTITKEQRQGLHDEYEEVDSIGQHISGRGYLLWSEATLAPPIHSHGYHLPQSNDIFLTACFHHPIKTTQSDEHPRQTLFREMQTVAHNGDLPQLHAQLTKWDIEVTDGVPATSKDYLWFEPTVVEWLEVFDELNRPQENQKSISTSWYIFNRLLIAASRANQVDIVTFLLEQRGCPITSVAHIQNNICTILRQIVNNENRTFSATPLDILPFQSCSCLLITVPILRIRAAKGGEARVEVLRWLLDEKDFLLNQREFEYNIEMFNDRQSNGLGTALHAAAETNSLACMQFLLERGIDANIPDTLGRTATNRAREYGSQEAVSFLEHWEEN
ncbi:hypothetical protein NUU61_008529 [Penicillium alfredii]|uniref:Protein kinase domain-containing protein n=1 Tax=Penicillium alfredii TaxID=1506179 RepID=A0A9W9ELK9_9EURO|nr:uncharacterized protein NUU61_008529 [Penicillium alfredii]KAJ5083950.1 hypothetical protein NUU61_008529 [Penicillium alfredii]